MIRVMIESPLRADTPEGYEVNRAYAKACMRHSLSLGEAPFAMHLLYAQPHILDDTVAAEREQGMNAGHAWALVAELVALYTDLGISSGMRRAIEQATVMGIAVVYRGGVWMWTGDIR